MKKILLTTIIMGMGAGLIGCTQASQNSSQTAQNNTQTVQSNESVNTQTDNTVANQNVDSKSNKITVDEAKKIALNHANLTSKEVSFINAEADMDNGVEFYDIEFYNNNKEYDYEISAADGKIIEYDYDVEGYGESTNVSNNNSSNTNKQNSNKSNNNTVNNNKANNNVVNTNKSNTNTNSNTSSNKISADKAKKIALNHANLTSNQVSYVQVEADFDDYTPSYDVEFYHNNVEYSYEINANNGNIISFEKDID